MSVQQEERMLLETHVLSCMRGGGNKIETDSKSGSRKGRDDAKAEISGNKLQQKFVLMPTVFEDIAVFFSKEAQTTIRDAEKEPYRNVMQEDYKTMTSVEPADYATFKVKEEVDTPLCDSLGWKETSHQQSDEANTSSFQQPVPYMTIIVKEEEPLLCDSVIRNRTVYQPRDEEHTSIKTEDYATFKVKEERTAPFNSVSRTETRHQGPHAIKPIHSLSHVELPLSVDMGNQQQKQQQLWSRLIAAAQPREEHMRGQYDALGHEEETLYEDTQDGKEDISGSAGGSDDGHSLGVQPERGSPPVTDTSTEHLGTPGGGSKVESEGNVGSDITHIFKALPTPNTPEREHVAVPVGAIKPSPSHEDDVKPPSSLACNLHAPAHQPCHCNQNPCTQWESNFLRLFKHILDAQHCVGEQLTDSQGRVVEELQRVRAAVEDATRQSQLDRQSLGENFVSATKNQAEYVTGTMSEILWFVDMTFQRVDHRLRDVHDAISRLDVRLAQEGDANREALTRSTSMMVDALSTLTAVVHESRAPVVVGPSPGGATSEHPAPVVERNPVGTVSQCHAPVVEPSTACTVSECHAPVVQPHPADTVSECHAYVVAGASPAAVVSECNAPVVESSPAGAVNECPAPVVVGNSLGSMVSESHAPVVAGPSSAATVCECPTPVFTETSPTAMLHESYSLVVAGPSTEGFHSPAACGCAHTARQSHPSTCKGPRMCEGGLNNRTQRGRQPDSVGDSVY